MLSEARGKGRNPLAACFFCTRTHSVRATLYYLKKEVLFIKMKPEEYSAWDSISMSASDVIALMRKNRSASLRILFRYGEELYQIGVDPSNRCEPFFMDKETYPSMFAFCSGASIEGGFLLPDLQEPLQILAINGGNPAAFLD